MPEHLNRADERLSRAWQIHYIDGPIATVATGLDARRPLAEFEAMRLRMVLAERGVVIVPNQRLDENAQARFNAAFGPLELTGRATGEGANQAVLRLSNRADGTPFSPFWHMDASSRFRPTILSTLHAVVVPAEAPGSMRFLSAALAYDGLPVALLKSLGGLHWIVGERTRAPILRAHPLTGRPLLWLPMRFGNAGAMTDEQLRAMLSRLNGDLRPRVEGLNDSQSERLTLVLVRHLTSRADWVHEHAWAEGDLVLWDQSTVYHHIGAGDDRLLLNRASVRGEPAVPFFSLQTA